MKNLKRITFYAIVLATASCQPDPSRNVTEPQSHKISIADLKEEYQPDKLDYAMTITAPTTGDTMTICGKVTNPDFYGMLFIEDNTAPLMLLAEDIGLTPSDSIEIDVTGLAIEQRNGEMMCGALSHRSDSNREYISTINSTDFRKRIRQRFKTSPPLPITITISMLANENSHGLYCHRLVSITDLYAPDSSNLYDSQGFHLDALSYGYSSKLRGSPIGKSDVTGILRHRLDGWMLLITDYTSYTIRDFHDNTDDTLCHTGTSMFPAFTLDDGMNIALWADSKVAIPQQPSEMPAYLYTSECKTKKDGSIELDETAILSLERHGSRWAILTPEGLRLQATDNASLTYSKESSEAALWDITIKADGTAIIANAHTSNTLQYIGIYHAFGCFSDNCVGKCPIIYTSK